MGLRLLGWYGGGHSGPEGLRPGLRTGFGVFELEKLWVLLGAWWLSAVRPRKADLILFFWQLASWLTWRRRRVLGDELRTGLSWSGLESKRLIRICGEGLLVGRCAGGVGSRRGVFLEPRVSDEGPNEVSPRQSPPSFRF